MCYFDKFHFLSAVWDILEQNFFGITNLDTLVANINDIEIFLHSISMSTQPNDVE